MGKRYKGRRAMKQSLRRYASDYVNVSQKPDKFKMSEYSLLNRPKPRADEIRNSFTKELPLPKPVWMDEDGNFHSITDIKTPRIVALDTAVKIKQSDRHQVYDHWYSYKIYDHGDETMRMFFHGEFYFLQVEDRKEKIVRRSIVYRSKQRAMFNLLNGKVLWSETFAMKM
jgi:hypothetical protein